MENECKHEKINTNCLNCGVFVYKNENGYNIFGKNSNAFKQNLDLDIIKVFDIIKLSNLNSEGKEINKHYINVRKERIKILKKLIKKNKYSIHVFFMSIFYLDKIGYSKDYLEHNGELLTIGCFILAGNIYLN